MKKILSVLLSILLLASLGIIAGAECAHEYDATYHSPTCITPGYKEFICSLCGDRIEEINVPANGHIYGEWEVLSEATCSQTGLKKRECRICGGVETNTISMTAHADTDEDGNCDSCDYVFEKEENTELSPYEWLKLFFANIIAWFKAIFA